MQKPLELAGVVVVCLLVNPKSGGAQGKEFFKLGQIKDNSPAAQKQEGSHNMNTSLQAEGGDDDIQPEIQQKPPQKKAVNN